MAIRPPSDSGQSLPSRIWDHVRKIGILSMAALFFGGLALFLIGINGLIDHHRRLRWESKEFPVGGRLPLQAWLAIIGLAFGSLSYGLNEAYIHLFDWWATRQARGAKGLDYARYLNTQLRAPVGYGIRGFPIWMTLKYFIGAASIAASIGYKFSLVESPIQRGHFTPSSDATWEVPSTAPFTADGWKSPWLADYYRGSSQLPTAFILETLFNESSSSRENVWNRQRTPEDVGILPATLLMTSMMGPKRAYFPWANEGEQTMREMVLIANLTEHGDNSSMSREDPLPEDGWRRARSGAGWVLPESNDSSAVVDYHIRASGALEIQWAPSRLWQTRDTSSNTSIPITRRLFYEVRYAVSAVTRIIGPGEMGPTTVFLPDIPTTLLSLDNDTIAFVGNTSEFNDCCGLWVDAMVGAERSTPLSGISMYLRLALAFLASENDADGPGVGYIDPSLTPFGIENDDAVLKNERDRQRSFIPPSPVSTDLRRPWFVE